MKKSVLTSEIKCIIFNLDELIPPAGVKELLAHLDLPYAVVSTTSRAGIEAFLDSVDLLTFFKGDQIFNSSGQLPGSGESAALIFLHAVRSMGFNPSDCAVVDKSDVGIDLARNEEFYVFGRNDGSGNTEFENKGILLFNEFEDLRDMIRLFNQEVRLEVKR